MLADVGMQATHPRHADSKLKMAKYLGSAAAGGKVRSTVFQDKRIEATRPVAQKAQTAGTIGISRRIIARAGVLRRLCYAPEQYGVSCSKLHIMRVVIA